jgi:hypothetical protein
MGELLIWLIILGAVAVVAVYVYNRMEEVRFRKRTESAFASQDGDALMDDELAPRAPVPPAGASRARLPSRRRPRPGPAPSRHRWPQSKP